MPFPLPLDPDFRLEVVSSWIDDVLDRIDLNDYFGAEESLKVANRLLLSLPPGKGCENIEGRLMEVRVKLESLQT